MSTAAIPFKIWSELSEAERNERVERSALHSEETTLKRIIEILDNRENIKAAYIAATRSCSIYAKDNDKQFIIRVKLNYAPDSKYIITATSKDNEPIVIPHVGVKEIRCENYNVLVRNIKRIK